MKGDTCKELLSHHHRYAFQSLHLKNDLNIIQTGGLDWDQSPTDMQFLGFDTETHVVE